MSILPGTPATEESQSFVIRMRVEGPLTRGEGSGAAKTEGKSEERLHIRVEHVNTADVSQHRTVEGALAWLRDRMAALLGRHRPRDTPGTAPARHRRIQ